MNISFRILCFHIFSEFNNNKMDFSVQEVNKHNQPNDLWVIYQNKVLNITSFLYNHPGGPDLLLEHKGSEITFSFDDIGHSNKAKEIMKTFIIGETNPIPPTTRRNPSYIHPELLQPEKQSSSQNFFYPIIIILLLIGFYFLFFQNY